MWKWRNRRKPWDTEAELGAGCHKPRNSRVAGCRQKPGGSHETDSPSEKSQPCQPLTLGLWPAGSERIHFCCSKTPSPWSLMIAARESSAACGFCPGRAPGRPPQLSWEHLAGWGAPAWEPRSPHSPAACGSLSGKFMGSSAPSSSYPRKVIMQPW